MQLVVAGRQLRQIVQSDMSKDHRAAAVSWLGHRGEERAFFAGLIENEREAGHIRKNAISALARYSNNEALSQLQSLYKKEENTDIKKRIISSMSTDRFGDAAGAFFLQVARDTGENRDARKHAISRVSLGGAIAHRLGLIDLYDGETDKLREKATYWLGKSNDPRAVRFFEDMFRN